MSLYAVQNDEGKWLGCEIYCDEPDWFDHGGFMWNILSVAEENIKLYGGHVVKLIDAPAKVVVSEEEAEMLEQAKSRKEYPAKFIHRYVYDSHNFSEWDYDREIRLMRAYVNGYTLAKEKKYNVKVPLVQSQGGLWFYINSEDKLDATYLQGMAEKFTIEEIEHYGLQDCDKEEVTDNEQ